MQMRLNTINYEKTIVKLIGKKRIYIYKREGYHGLCGII